MDAKGGVYPDHSGGIVWREGMFCHFGGAACPLRSGWPEEIFGAEALPEPVGEARTGAKPPKRVA